MFSKSNFLLLAFSLTLLFPSLIWSNEYTLDASHTNVQFSVKHLGVSFTKGRFNDVSGSFTFDPAQMKKNQVSVTIQSASVDSNSAKRDLHLRGEDFFDVEKYPTITFVSTGFKKAGKDKDQYLISGKVTLRGVTKKVVAKAKFVGKANDPWQKGKHRVGFECSFVVKRSEFGMNYMPGGIGDNVRLKVSVEGISK